MHQRAIGKEPGEATPAAPAPAGRSLRAKVGLPLGAALLAGMVLLPAPAGLSAPGWHAAAVSVLMATWWITEALPISATALVPILAFPLLGVSAVGEAAAPYAHPIIFLFLGGFMIAAAFQRWGLHRRLALSIVGALGTSPRRVVASFMLATAFMSMWVSNTATVVIMLPIGLSVVDLVVRRQGEDARSSNFAVALMLGIAYAASIGGLGTLIGTPPNALLAGFLAEAYGRQIGFAQWMLVGVPLVVVALPLTYFVLTRLVFPVRLKEIPGGRELIEAELAALGPFSRPEALVTGVTILTAVAWIARPAFSKVVPGLSDGGIAIGGALLMFLLPAGDGRGEALLDWDSAADIPWGVLVLFGGGLSLAHAIDQTGLAAWIGSSLSAFGGLPVVVVAAIVTTVVIFLTEMTSNTATAAVFLPIVGALAVGIGQDPVLLAAPAALAASCAFMLPVATPPNAIVYGSGHVTLPQMVRAGLLLNLAFIVLVTLTTFLLVRGVLMPAAS